MQRHKLISKAGRITLIQGDAVSWLAQQAEETPGTFDMIFTDLPYWTLDKWRHSGTTTRLGGTKRLQRDRTEEEDPWFDVLPEPVIRQVVINLSRLLKPNAHAYLMCDDETSDYLKGYYAAGLLDFDYCKRIVWDKVDGGMGYHWRASYEFIMMFEKGRRKLNDPTLKDVRHVKRVQGDHYPTEKPLALVEPFILNSTDEEDLVLDPFCGSGVVGLACIKHRRRAVLIDNHTNAVQRTMDKLIA